MAAEWLNFCVRVTSCFVSSKTVCRHVDCHGLRPTETQSEWNPIGHHNLQVFLVIVWMLNQCRKIAVSWHDVEVLDVQRRQDPFPRDRRGRGSQWWILQHGWCVPVATRQDSKFEEMWSLSWILSFSGIIDLCQTRGVSCGCASEFCWDKIRVFYCNIGIIGQTLENFNCISTKVLLMHCLAMSF